MATESSFQIEELSAISKIIHYSYRINNPFLERWENSYLSQKNNHMKKKPSLNQEDCMRETMEQRLR